MDDATEAPQPSFASRSWPWLRIVTAADPTITPDSEGSLSGLSQMRPDWRKLRNKPRGNMEGLSTKSRKSSVATNFLQAIEANKARGIAGRLIVDFKRV
jgi:hypothetical protein